ncbi:DUF2577 domain-containing protein [Bacillus sp. S/N-304-OC-R1]|uniref:DUF2577 domain-containing protein n=1 Tax=Bacillus sp. S/N-304-OC-R1 TaxID=2758034 RepID=UPI0021B08712|nr:DUF2577 domain-containing protein [Bacillus sp. S/N-304-OC-R1]MBY0122147.1 DUF2577 domain-containing protein [Bacillus sp. S/N-304-OC-R1]
MDDIVILIKKAAREAMGAIDLTAIEFGQVTSVSPLKVNVEQKKELTTAQLILTRNVRDYEIEMSVDHVTEVAEGHSHEYEGRKKFIVHNALKVGDTVMLVKMQGGQRYIVWDKEVVK